MLKIDYSKQSSFSRHGFTLIEVLLVALVLVVVAGLTVPNFSTTFQKFELKKTAEDIVYVMRYAQSRAITKGKSVRLEFNVDGREYWLSEISTDEDTAELMYTKISGRMGRTHRYPPEIDLELEEGEEGIGFSEDGSIDKQHLLVCREQRCWTISTKEQRGYVRLIDGRLDEENS